MTNLEIRQMLVLVLDPKDVREIATRQGIYDGIYGREHPQGIGFLPFNTEDKCCLALMCHFGGELEVALLGLPKDKVSAKRASEYFGGFMAFIIERDVEGGNCAGLMFEATNSANN